MIPYKKSTLDYREFKRENVQEFSCCPYPGERLCDVILRSRLENVSLDASAPLLFDDDGVDDVDPSSDIRTDRFALAETAEHQRSAAIEMTKRADAVSVQSSVELSLIHI